MQPIQPPRTSATAESIPLERSWGLQRSAQPAATAPATEFTSASNFYQQQLQQQLQQQIQQHLLPRTQLQQGNEFQFPAHLSTPEQRYQALLQQHQQSAPPQADFALDSFVQALGGHLTPQAAALRPPATQPQQSVQSHPIVHQLSQAHTSAAQQQPAAKSQPAPNGQPVLTRFSGPASSSFQPHALTSRLGLQQSASQAAPSAPQASAAPAQVQLHYVAQHSQPGKLPATHRPVVASVPSDAKQASSADAPQNPSSKKPEAAPLAYQPLAAAIKQHIEPEAVSPNDAFDEIPQVLRPPPPGKVVWAKLARYPWWPAEV